MKKVTAPTKAETESNEFERGFQAGEMHATGDKKAVAIIPKKDVLSEGDPEIQLAYAMKAANALMTAIGQKAKPVMIRGEQYLEYSDWQTLARFFGATAAIEWTKPIADTGGNPPKILGYEARATVLHQGVVISSAEAMCMRAERNWKDRDEFMLRSMAQTRAAAKALRNAYGWVAELAGMKSTPAEEMDGVEQPRTPVQYTVKRTVEAQDDEAQGKRTYPQMDETNDIAPLKEVPAVSDKAASAQKMDIAILLKKNHGYTMLGKSAKAVGDKVKEITGLPLEEEFYSEIIQKLSVVKNEFDEFLDEN